MKNLSQFISPYLNRQLQNYFPDGHEVSEQLLESCVIKSLKKLEYSFKFINTKYYQGDFKDIFNYLNGDHYAMFLYWVSSFLYKDANDEKSATKVFLLNKALHGIDAFYKINLPDIFFFCHPLGTILGNAKYSNFLCIYQGCTVGAKNMDYKYPAIGENVVLYANTTVLGDCQISDNVSFAANSLIIDTNVPSESLVTGTFPSNKIINLPEEKRQKLFKI